MKYMGSKSRIAKEIVPIIQQYVDQLNGGIYIEPFVGGANVIDKVKCERRMGFDINQYLISLFKYLQSGGILPEEITREEYAAVRADKNKFPAWYVGCVGFLASYNGKFFGGYAGIVHTKAGTIRNYYDEARRNLLQQVDTITPVGFECWDYRQKNGCCNFTNCVIYCDPPYMGTTEYAERFNHTEFWETMREWSKCNTVLISEQSAPDDFTCIWEKSVTRTQDNAKRTTATERLYKYAE